MVYETVHKYHKTLFKYEKNQFIVKSIFSVLNENKKYVLKRDAGISNVS